MKSVKSGILLLTLGCVLIMVGYPTHLNEHNLFLLLSLALVLSGAAMAVMAYKRRSRY